MPTQGSFVWLRQASGHEARHRVNEDRGTEIVVMPPFEGRDVVLAGEVIKVDESSAPPAPGDFAGP